MAQTRAAYRYALAILETAEEQKTLERVSKDFEEIEQLINSSRDFLLFLRSPVVNTQKKKTVFSNLFKKTLSELSFAFIMLLTTKNREGLLPLIIEQFYRLRDQRLGIENVSVRSAVKLTTEEEKKLVAHLERVTKKKVHLRHSLDKQFKGGLAVQIGDTVWDGSVAHQLEILRERFTKGVHT